MPRRPHARPLGRLAGLVLLLAAGLGLAGCPIESDEPLGPSAEANEDPAIYGLWFAKENDAPAWFHIYRPKGAAPGAVEVVLVSLESDGAGEAERYVGHLTRLGELDFANVRGPLEGDAATGPYYLVNYRIAADGTLELRLLKEATVEAAIAAKTLAGETTDDGKPTDHVTDSAEGLRAFVAATDPALLFEAPIRLLPIKAQP
jgi:hypothetical protein